MNSEDIYRAGSMMQSAAADMLRAASTIEESTRRLEMLFGQGYGTNLDRLIEALENQAKTDELGEALEQRDYASKLLENESRDSVKIAEELFRVTKHRDACEAQFQAKVSELGEALEQRNRLANILDSFPRGLHPEDERGPCLCSQCKFLRERDAALAEMGIKTTE